MYFVRKTDYAAYILDDERFITWLIFNRGNRIHDQRTAGTLPQQTEKKEEM